jgi:3-dehydroquinate synthase
MEHLQQDFNVNYRYKVYFTGQLFSPSNAVFNEFLEEGHQAGIQQKIFFVIDKQVVDNQPNLIAQIDTYFAGNEKVKLISEKIIISGGEGAKNDEKFFDQITEAVSIHSIDRHSYIAAIGGGAILDLVGYAAAVSHRGIKHIRIPTTILSQNDSGVGVKNGINYLGKKNFLGTFAPPVAVFNDFDFLVSLSDRHWRAGISEAVKVSLIKDSWFFEWIEKNTNALASRDKETMQYLIWHCAKLHMQHIGGGDPFEKGSSRPLDFGHWSAHKLEQLTNFEVLHGEAVAIGIALDTVYSSLSGRLPKADSDRVIKLLIKLGLPVTHQLIVPEDEQSPILLGLEEFREHLGGRLTIMLLGAIGKGEEVNDIDPELVKKAAREIQSGVLEGAYS